MTQSAGWSIFINLVKVISIVIFVISIVTNIIQKKKLTQISKEEKEVAEKTIANIQKLNRKISKDTKSIRILFIDDEDYGIVDDLNKRGYNVYFYGGNIQVDYVEQCEPFDIIFVDFKGVANKSFSQEGFSYAHSVKMKYPFKTVILYSSGDMKGRTPESPCNVKDLDDFLNKHADIDAWTVELDKRIAIFSSTDYQKNAFEKLLITEKVDQEKYKILKDSFENVLINKDLNSFLTKLVENIDDIDVIHNIFEAAASILTYVGGNK